MTSAALAPVSGIAADIVAMLPMLRAFATSLCRDRSAGMGRDADLVQETIAKALEHADQFTPGTNLRSWLFAIMRNEHYSRFRIGRREVRDEDDFHALKLVSAPVQIPRVELREVGEAFGRLTRDHRSALLLVGVEGLSYGQAALLEHVATGTMKSRVSRARAALVEALDPR